MSASTESDPELQKTFKVHAPNGRLLMARIFIGLSTPDVMSPWALCNVILADGSNTWHFGLSFSDLEELPLFPEIVPKIVLEATKHFTESFVAADRHVTYAGADDSGTRTISVHRNSAPNGLAGFRYDVVGDPPRELLIREVT